MKAITPYLIFDGNCREAMTFYQQCLGGELFVMTFAEAEPGATQDAAKGASARLAHARLTRGETVLMASDSAPGMPASNRGDGVWLSLACESDEEVERLFTLLAEGGRVMMPPHDAFWGARFAMLADRYGSSWMLSHEKAPVGTAGSGSQQQGAAR